MNDIPGAGALWMKTLLPMTPVVWTYGGCSSRMNFPHEQSPSEIYIFH